MTTDDYRASLDTSFTVENMRQIMAVLQYMERAPMDAIGSATVRVVNPMDRQLADIWWDPANERWMIQIIR